MNLTVTLNAAMDKTYLIPDFTLGLVNRPLQQRTYAGGKGINVARVLHRLGCDTYAIGVLGGRQGRQISAALLDEGIRGSFIRVTSESRLCIAVVDGQSQLQTEINEPGPELDVRSCNRFIAFYRRTLAGMGSGTVALSGRLPPGAPDDIYAQLIHIANRAGFRCVLDTSSAALANALAARPWLVKPNRAELAQLCGCELPTCAAVVEAARLTVLPFADVCAVTLGSEGAVLITQTESLQADCPPIEFVSAVGSGDSFAAGVLYGLGSGCTWREALKVGIGAGSANAEVYGSGFIGSDRVLELASRVTVVDL